MVFALRSNDLGATYGKGKGRQMVFRGLRLRRHTPWLNPIVQLAMAATVCAGLPYFLLSFSYPMGWNDYVLQNTVLACIIGLVIGFWLHRSFSKLPGTYESFGILPAYLAAFGVVLLIIVLYRIEYSRALLVFSFAACVAWFFGVYLTVQRKTVLRLGVITGGRTGLFDSLDGVTASTLALASWPEDIDAVTADFHYDHSDEWEARIADFTLAGIPVYHSKDLLESLTGRTELEQLSENTFGALGPVQSWLALKWISDWLMALLLIPLLVPVMVLAAIAIKLDSPGTVLFRQLRIGYRGKDFRVFKFRTMHDTNGKAGPKSITDLITAGNDPRITRVGRFLRFMRIDELPQLFNVLRGEMALIGPRPEAAGLSNWYQAEVPFYRYRHIVRPGITGWAQVNQGHVADLADIKKKLEYDFYYIRNFSIWLDILIVMKTIKTVVTGFGYK
jgi:lipopolysaccharide/colanic/teichoic acid biosynthesis glycosyltransferase